MSTLFDINTPVTKELIHNLIVSKNTKYTVVLADQTVTMVAGRIALNIHFWQPLIRRGLPVATRHVTKAKELINKKIIAEKFTAVYHDVITLNPDDPDILREICEQINAIYNMTTRELCAYHGSFSIFEIVRLFKNDKIKKLTEFNIDKELAVGTRAAEDKLKSINNELMTILADPTVPDNKLEPFIRLGLISAQAIPQMFIAAGYRTDANDTTVRRPILRSLMAGMASIEDFMTESLSAKKAVYYNAHGVRKSQYDNRKLQLLTNVIRRVYPGDCGSQLTIDFYVHKDNAKNLIGKYHVVGDNIEMITDGNVNNFMGHTIYLRSPMTCRHTDGFCHICGGAVAYTIKPNVNIGIFATQEVMGPAAQQILSAKHFSKTDSSQYMVPDELRDMFVVQQDDVFFRNGINTTDMKIGINYDSMSRIHDLQYTDDGNAQINEHYFSEIESVVFANTSGKLLTGQVPMVAAGSESMPRFTMEFLTFIRTHFKKIEINIDGFIWIPLKGFNRQEPIFRCTVENDSAMKFSATLSNFLSAGIRKHTTLSGALMDFTNIIYRKVPTNIMYIETMLKAHLITDSVDYRVPVVYDPNHVRFSSLDYIIPRRSLGAQLAFEELPRFLNDATTYTIPHGQSGCFDVYVPDLGADK